MVNYFLPHMYDTSNCVVYTGTHDNDTLQGWLENLGKEQALLVAQYIMGQELSIDKVRAFIKSGRLRKEMIRAVFASSAVYAIVPMQDLTGVDNTGRMNMPSTTGTNWTWRMNKGDLKPKQAQELEFLSALYGRNL